MSRFARAGATVLSIVAAAALVLVLRDAAGAGEAEGVGADPTEDSSEADLVAQGEQLFLTGCVSCHGVGGEGSELAPSLIGVGEASADFQLRTGRMPAAMAQGEGQPPTKPPAYDDDEIRALVAYVGSLGDGPSIPDVQPSRGDLVEGGDLYRANCAACHNAAGIGGALSSGDYAPSLSTIHPTQIGEAMRIGPGQMPKFGPEEITDEELDSIVRYVLYLQQPADPGGFSLGGTGPTAEGFVAWMFGLGAAVVAALFVTREVRRRGAAGEQADAERAAAAASTGSTTTSGDAGTGKEAPA